MSDKKKYYRIDNGDIPVIDADLKVLMEIIESESSCYPNEEETEKINPEWTIDLIWLTDEEFQNLEDA